MSLFNKALADSIGSPDGKQDNSGGTLGGRKVDASNKNIGNLRCPVCGNRLLSSCGTLVERQGDEQVLCVPTRIVDPKNNGSSESNGNDNDTKAAEKFKWEEDMHQWWWCVPDVDSFSCVGLSRFVESPRGQVKMVLCSDCQSGPYGYQTPEDPRVWLCCGLLKQQDASLANDADDFKIPEGVDVAALRQMIASGSLSTQFDVAFDQPRLGMMLADDVDCTGVEVYAFTVSEDGEKGAAESSGQVNVGDVVVRVNDESTSGLDYAAVLKMIIKSGRPIKLRFERNGSTQRAAKRVAHEEWKPPDSEDEGSAVEKSK